MVFCPLKITLNDQYLNLFDIFFCWWWLKSWSHNLVYLNPKELFGHRVLALCVIFYLCIKTIFTNTLDDFNIFGTAPATPIHVKKYFSQISKEDKKLFCDERTMGKKGSGRYSWGNLQKLRFYHASHVFNPGFSS